jgi:hypothetical protein
MSPASTEGTMSDLTLNIFPVESSASTVTFTVWLGVCVVVFFNLRFGWTLSGLVVPGYLVPLMLVKPMSVTIIVVEAIATYLLVRLLSDCGGRFPFWSSFFGRDRFFAIVLVSVLVRAAGDGWWLPLIGRWLTSTYGWQIDYRNDLHSYGLIVVSLLANYFWKPRLARGLFTSGVCLALTYVLLRGLILNVTNFSLGSLHYMYEDISASLLASPKAYVIVITTAYLASWMNLRYSWDFNGILIPALLGLLWHDVTKIAVTVIESLWILVLSTWVLKLPVWQGVTVEGGRKLLLFFSISAAHRLFLSHLLPWLDQANVTDYFGFGYLLTTLMALKSHEKKITLRVFRATLQTSMLGAVLGSLFGFMLSYLPADLGLRRGANQLDSTARQTIASERSLWEVLQEQRIRLCSAITPGRYQVVLSGELSRFRSGVVAALQYATTHDEYALQRAQDLLTQVNYQVHLLRGRYLIFLENVPVRGWGTYVIDMRQSSGMLVEVPSPLEEWATFEAGFALFREFRGRALAISGTARGTNSDRSSDVIQRRATMMAAFHRALDQHDTVQVRGAARKASVQTARQAAGNLQRPDRSVLYVKASLPPSLTLSRLAELVPNVDIQWQNAPGANVLRDLTARGFGELILSHRDLRHLRNLSTGEVAGPLPLMQVTGHLNRWLQDERQHLAPRGSNAYLQATIEDMLFLDQEVVAPLIQLVRRCRSIAVLQPDEVEEATSIGMAASALGYALVLFHDCATNDDYFVLRENVPHRRHWGTYVFRAGLGDSLVVEVPRPLYEEQTFQFGVSLLERPRAAALLIAGAHPLANVDGTADLTRLANKVSALHLVRHVLLRELLTEPMLILQARAIQAPAEGDILIATDDGSARPEELSRSMHDVIDHLRGDGIRVRIVDGSEPTAGYELGLLLQASSTLHSQNKQMASLWLSPSLRRKFRDSLAMRLPAAVFETLTIPTVEAELFDYLEQQDYRPSAGALDRRIIDAVRGYQANADIIQLRRIQREFPQSVLTRLIDSATDQAFLLVQPCRHALPAIFNLDGAMIDDVIVIDQLRADAVRSFARSRRFALEIKGAP